MRLSFFSVSGLCQSPVCRSVGLWGLLPHLLKLNLCHEKHSVLFTDATVILLPLLYILLSVSLRMFIIWMNGEEQFLFRQKNIHFFFLCICVLHNVLQSSVWAQFLWVTCHAFYCPSSVHEILYWFLKLNLVASALLGRVHRCLWHCLFMLLEEVCYKCWPGMGAIHRAIMLTPGVLSFGTHSAPPGCLAETGPGPVLTTPVWEGQNVIPISSLSERLKRTYCWCTSRSLEQALFVFSLARRYLKLLFLSIGVEKWRHVDGFRRNRVQADCL